MLPTLTALNGKQIGQTLSDFCHDFGVPEELKFDGIMVETGAKTPFQQLLHLHTIKRQVLEPQRPN